MSESNEAPAPTSKFTYPFPVSATAAGGGPDTREASGPQEYYEALAQAEDGFYPIGYNGQWHGGIHFGAQTGEHLAQDDGVRCIADGEVIAWKIDEEYPEVEYASCGAATYSTGFVLVRHRLQLPRADRGQASDAGADGTAAADQDESGQQQESSLLFYSLYIHLLDWASYSDDTDKARPAFWGESAYLVGEEANDSDRNRNPHIPEGGVGLNLRNAANAIVGVALRSTQLHLGERRGTTGYYAVTGVESGTVLPTGLDLANVYAYRDELTPVPVEPQRKDEIVIPDGPVPIAAGDLAGHLGQYQRYIDMNPLCSSSDERELMQIDVFTTDDIEAFIEQSRERATQLSDRHKTLLLVDQGARLVRAPEGGGSPTGEQLAARRDNADGPEVVHSRVIPIKALGEAVTEEDGTRWWNVEAGSAKGESVWGWVCERDHANVRLCTPWDWPGFEIVQVDHTRPDQFYANQVHRQGNAAQNEESELQERGEPAESGSIFRKLYDLIDEDGDKKIVSDEIRLALRKPWLAQALSHLIVHHESEWSGPMDKWDAIDELIPKQREKDWRKEKERIESLLWWRDVKGQHGLSNDEPLVAYSLHPVGMVSAFRLSRDTTAYRVYQNGLIEKLAPSRITEESIRNARYIYVDARGNEHDFGVFVGTQATRWIRKNSPGTEPIYLMNASELGENHARQFGFRFTATERRYLSQTALASLIGALMNVGYDDVTSTGFSMRDGSPGVSSSHINGENGDFRFLRIDRNPNTPTHLNTTSGVNALDEERQGAFNDALFKFGWTSQLAWRYSKNGKQRLLPRTIHYAGHHHHLHVGGYAPNLVESEQ